MHPHVNQALSALARRPTTREDWMLHDLATLRQEGVLAFRARNQALVLVTPSAKRRGRWQATWFSKGGPYQDRLAPTPQRLLWGIHGFIRDRILPAEAERTLRKMLC